MPFRTLLSLLAICACLHSHAQTKEKRAGYILSGQLRKAGNRKIYLYERAFYKRVNRVDSTKADPSGRFIFHGVVDEPTYYSLQTEVNHQGLGFYLENRPMRVTGHADTLFLAQVTGSPEESIRQLYDKTIQGFDYNSLWQREAQARSQNDTAALRAVKQQIILTSANERQAIRALMKQYPFATASINSVERYIASRSSQDLIVADSLLKVYESSPVARHGQVVYFRQAWLAAQKMATGQIAADFTQPDTTGQPVQLTNFRGRYVLVDLWASWCGPCREQSPYLVQASKQFVDRNFTILSVSLDKNRANWLKAICDDQLKWTHVSDLRYWDNAVARSYSVSAIPFNFLLDPAGKILGVNLFGDQLLDSLKTILPSRR